METNRKKAIIDMMKADEELGLYEEYAGFCVFSDREGLPLLRVEDWFNRYKLTSQEQINSIIDVINTQGVISEGAEPVLVEDDCTCDKCGKESRGSHSCPFDEEFNSGVGLDSCNCCDSCRRECLYDI